MISPTKRRTFSRERWEAAQAAWDAAHFSAEWKPWRHLAAMEASIIDPPTGTEWDSWADDEPSERALIIRAIRETPELLRRAILSPGVHSWPAVVAVLLRGRDAKRADLDEEERGEEARRQESREAERRAAGPALTRIADLLAGRHAAGDAP